MPQSRSEGAAAAQLPLPFKPRQHSTFERFVAGANGELLQRLRRRHEGFDCLWLFGAPGVGKTHLLQALCLARRNACYVPATELAASDGALNAYARFAVVAVDDLPRWLGSRASEVSFIGFYQRLLASEAQLVLTAHRSPRELRFAVPDLGSRLRAAACYRIAPLRDEDKPRLLAEAAEDRGLWLGDEVIRFILDRVSRDQAELLRVLDRLDRSSLASQRRVTIPFAKEVLCL